MSKINVFSEIGILKEVLVHTPGDEIRRISPTRFNELLFSAVLESDVAIKEHKGFLQILKEQGIKVTQLTDLVLETWNFASNAAREEFVNKWINEAKPRIKDGNLKIKIKEFLNSKTPLELIKTMMTGILKYELGIEYKHELVVDPMPNLYFTRDPFTSVGNGITINNMKYQTRKRETLFSEFIFSHHPDYKNTPRWFDRMDSGNIEGGDLFVYTSETLVVGISERTKKKAILQIAKNIKNSNTNFKRIVIVKVPIMENLMHLDTWLVMVDYDKFIYSPNVTKALEFWDIDLTDKIKIKPIKSQNLEQVLTGIIGKRPVLIPVAGTDANQIDIDVETHFDATNYLTIRPGVVVGYSRNRKTEAALIKAGVKVYSFEGNQLSLGMGSARCMSMPLVRENLK
ncbi:arginine deiminase domain-containing protein [Mycoplasmopsis californica]|uniref:Arginine deiminase family protein n=1 Tax=Mycoplasmopsis equigenitalium TaxID=114883 RepID=A0ABY5J2Q9_9BACT|nr:arginine deiminase family protein [Mycoplasmopsis equigenitalium]UUD37053.1 arginine deiminase family protein [Mycoplasmopsis equigenitalium]VEU69647.1 arginine deiminase domain-containing protein [Mycoplasmopsis californica]